MSRLKGNDYIRWWDNETRRWVYEHRVTMEKHIGRCLTSEEHVHHKDGNCINNELDNLEILSRAEHASISKNKRSLHPHCDIPGCEKPHHARGFCRYHYRINYDHLWHASRY